MKYFFNYVSVPCIALSHRSVLVYTNEFNMIARMTGRVKIIFLCIIEHISVTFNYAECGYRIRALNVLKYMNYSLSTQK